MVVMTDLLNRRTHWELSIDYVHKLHEKTELKTRLPRVCRGPEAQTQDRRDSVSLSSLWALRTPEGVKRFPNDICRFRRRVSDKIRSSVLVCQGGLSVMIVTLIRMHANRRPSNVLLVSPARQNVK